VKIVTAGVVGRQVRPAGSMRQKGVSRERRVSAVIRERLALRDARAASRAPLQSARGDMAHEVLQ